jgi:hypothetical protein
MAKSVTQKQIEGVEAELKSIHVQLEANAIKTRQHMASLNHYKKQRARLFAQDFNWRDKLEELKLCLKIEQQSLEDKKEEKKEDKSLSAVAADVLKRVEERGEDGEKDPRARPYEDEARAGAGSRGPHPSQMMTAQVNMTVPIPVRWAVPFADRFPMPLTPGLREDILKKRTIEEMD